MNVSNRRLQQVSAFVLGLIISFTNGPVLAQVTAAPLFVDGKPSVEQHTQITAPESLENFSALSDQEERGRQLYLAGQFSAAIAQWQQVVAMHARQNNVFAQASTLSNLALGYQKLGQWEEAQAVIARSFDLLAQNYTETPKTLDYWQVRAQVLMAQGSGQRDVGQVEEAFETWQQAADAYTRTEDSAGYGRAQINQAQALRELGFYARAQEKLVTLQQTLETQPVSLLKATLLRRLGEALKLAESVSEAQTALTQSLEIANQYDNKTEKSSTLLSLGNLARSQGDVDAATDFYAEALAEVSTLSAAQKIPIQLAQLSLWVSTANWREVATLWPAIQSQFEDLSPSRSSVYHQVSWAKMLIVFNQALAKASKATPREIPSVPWITVAAQLQKAAQQAQQLVDVRAESHAVGLLGQVYEQTQQWEIAQAQTQRALRLAQGEADIAYRWQWQLGRVLKSPMNPQRSFQKAIEAYEQAIVSLTRLRGDLAMGSDRTQFSFKKNVEPVYRQLVDLLLKTDPQANNYQANLARAQDVIESLRLAELDNYFKEACIDIQPVDISQVDPAAAIVYSILLDDRLSVIWRLPNQPLQQFSTAISAGEVADVTKGLRQQLVIRSRRDYYDSAQQLYRWLIEPAKEALVKSDVETIVFVLDGPLQNVPMAALYDGEHFLIEDYNVALTPGLKLLNPQPWDTGDLSTLIAGLTESRFGLAPLPYVATEIDNIKGNISRSNILLNQEFTQQSLPTTLKAARYPIVHIATHGQFGSTPEETYLVAWDEPIEVREISQILQANLGDRKAIELLVLSACETASGDQSAALGLSGVAVKAGARSTLGTLWAINDEATSYFIDRFYDQLTQPGATRASALRAAQLTLLSDPQYKHPIYWAPYLLLGSWL
ncbi:MAG: CHAT domain-containing protein [Cyanobacteria bacterium J06597_16]